MGFYRHEFLWFLVQRFFYRNLFRVGRDLPFSQKILEILISKSKNKFWMDSCLPSRPDFIHRLLFPLNRFFGGANGAGRECETDSFTIVIEKDVVPEPSEMLAIDSVNSLLFIQIGDRGSGPKENSRPKIRRDVGDGIPILIEYGGFDHR